MTNRSCDVLIVGAGPAGLSAGIFTARHGLDTLLVDAGQPILKRNAHLENFPGFPAGIDSRHLLDMMADQADRAGCDRRDGRVVRLKLTDAGFRARTAASDSIDASQVIAATKNTVDYLEEMDGIEIVDRGKSFVETDERGRTDIAGLYAAGRLAGQPHQAVVCAGHGASVGLAAIEESAMPFYHDWVAPEGYFTGRDRDVPPGCVEISEGERRRRDEAARDGVVERLAEPHSEEPVQHPNVDGD